MSIALRNSRYRTKCQFSKQIIEKGSCICLFNQTQYNNFEIVIKNCYCFSILPDDIVNIIIKKTNYEKYINHWGLIKYVNWSENFELNNDSSSGSDYISSDDNHEYDNHEYDSFK